MNQPKARKNKQKYNIVNNVSSVKRIREQVIQAKEEKQQTKPSRTEKEAKKENKTAINIGRILWI